MGEAVTILSRKEAMALQLSERPLCMRLPEAVYNAVWEHMGRASFATDQRECEKAAVDLCLFIADYFDTRPTIDEVMSALSDAFPSPRTSRDCVVEKNLRDILSARNVEVDSAPPKSKPWTERIVGANQP